MKAKRRKLGWSKNEELATLNPDIRASRTHGTVYGHIENGRPLGRWDAVDCKSNSETRKIESEIENYLRAECWMTLPAFQEMMGWTDHTLIARRARRQTPREYRKGATVLLAYRDISDWFRDPENITANEAQPKTGSRAAIAALLK